MLGMTTPQHSTSLLMKHAPLNYSVDASMLSSASGQLFGPIYDDSGAMTIHQGFVLVSAKSGRGMRMQVVSTHRNADDDITHWVLQSEPEDARRLSTPVLTVTVWNT